MATRGIFGGDAAEATFAAVVVTFAEAMAMSEQVALRVETLRDEQHMLTFKAGTEALDGFNLSLSVDAATQLRDQINKALDELKQRAALKN